jgi:hypothetical protein
MLAARSCARRGFRTVLVRLFLLAATLHAYPAVAADATPTGQTITARQLALQAHSASLRVLLALSQARSEGRQVLARCLDDQLAQLNSLSRVLDRASTELRLGQLDTRLSTLLAQVQRCAAKTGDQGTLVVLIIDPPQPAGEPRPLHW